MSQASAAHRITIEPNPRRLQIKFNGQIVADTTRALTLREGSLPPVQYLPRADANLTHFVRSDTTTRCPFKGEASYYSLVVDGQTAPDAVWTYETPNPEVAAIKDHLAFYPNRVERIETTND
jgi:uncharacterized protein (DUF427 family)